MTIVRRSPIVVRPVVKYVPGGAVQMFEYHFVITLENGTTQDITGCDNNRERAMNAAIKHFGRIEERGYQA